MRANGLFQLATLNDQKKCPNIFVNVSTQLTELQNYRIDQWTRPVMLVGPNLVSEGSSCNTSFGISRFFPSSSVFLACPLCWKDSECRSRKGGEHQIPAAVRDSFPRIARSLALLISCLRALRSRHPSEPFVFPSLCDEKSGPWDESYFITSETLDGGCRSAFWKCKRRWIWRACYCPYCGGCRLLDLQASK